ncbi:MAG: NADPH-dependent F420 reductase [bacterium]
MHSSRRRFAARLNSGVRRRRANLVKGTNRSKQMKIGIIGAGKIGSTLARKLAKAGHSVLIANSRGPETLRNLADETGAKAVSAQEAMHGVNVVILSIPFAKLPLMREFMARLQDDVVVADTSNYFPVRDGQIPAIDGGQVESLWVSEQIGHPVVKAWNNVLAVVLAGKGLPAGAEGRIALSVAGDDSAAKNVVMSLVEDTGFDAIDGDSLAESWRQHPMTRAYCSELTADELRAALAAADRARAPQLREEMVKKFMALGDKITTEDVVRLHRAASTEA